MNIPGPGAYEQPIKKAPKSPRYSFGVKVVSDKSFVEIPGPGSYDFSLSMDHIPGSSFPKDEGKLKHK